MKRYYVHPFFAFIIFCLRAGGRRRIKWKTTLTLDIGKILFLITFNETILYSSFFAFIMFCLQLSLVKLFLVVEKTL